MSFLASVGGGVTTASGLGKRRRQLTLQNIEKHHMALKKPYQRVYSTALFTPLTGGRDTGRHLPARPAVSVECGHLRHSLAARPVRKDPTRGHHRLRPLRSAALAAAAGAVPTRAQQTFSARSRSCGVPMAPTATTATDDAHADPTASPSSAPTPLAAGALSRRRHSRPQKPGQRQAHALSEAEHRARAWYAPHARRPARCLAGGRGDAGPTWRRWRPPPWRRPPAPPCPPRGWPPPPCRCGRRPPRRRRSRHATRPRSVPRRRGGGRGPPAAASASLARRTGGDRRPSRRVANGARVRGGWRRPGGPAAPAAAAP